MAHKHLAKVDIIQNSALAPRLDYSLELLDAIIESLKQTRTIIAKNNCTIFHDLSNKGAFEHALYLEKTVSFSIEILSQIQKRSSMISSIVTIPQIMTSAVSTIRTISASLHEISPESSKKLSELSVHLGSIVLDSATLTKAQFDFNKLNYESAILLDKVKLMVDSKIDKQYPNLETFEV